MQILCGANAFETWKDSLWKFDWLNSTFFSFTTDYINECSTLFYLKFVVWEYSKCWQWESLSKTIQKSISKNTKVGGSVEPVFTI